MFVTTSDFTKDARGTAGLLSKRIVLIGGDQGMEVSDIELAHDLLSGDYLENIETVSEYLE